MTPQELRFCRLLAAAPLCGDSISTRRLTHGRLHRFFVGQHLRHRVMPLGMIGFLLNGMIVLLKDRMPRLSRSSTAAFPMDGGRSTAALHRDSGRLT